MQIAGANQEMSSKGHRTLCASAKLSPGRLRTSFYGIRTFGDREERLNECLAMKPATTFPPVLDDKCGYLSIATFIKRFICSPDVRS